MGWLGTWAKRKAIKYGTVFPGANLTDFPLLLKIAADTDIGSELSAQKFALTLADGTTTVPYGAVSYSESGGDVTANLRAKFSPLTAASTGDVMGYLYYDDAQTDTQDKASVLDSNMVAYWPLEEDPNGSAPQMLDWSSNAYNGTRSGSVSSQSGQVANGIKGSGPAGSGLITTGYTGSIVGDFTISLLFKSPSVGFDHERLIDKDYENGFWIGRNGTNADSWGGGIKNTWAPYGIFVTLTDGAWHQLVFKRSGSTQYVIGDGGSVSNSVSCSTDDLPATLRFLAVNGYNYTNSYLDEVMLASVARSADWIAYDYQNQFNNSDTVTLGTEENIPSGFVSAWARNSNIMIQPLVSA